MRFKKGVCLVSRVCPGSPRANCPGPPVSFYRYCIGRLRARRAVVRACGCGSEVVRDGCEVRLCDPCVRVSGSPPVSFYRYCIVPVPMLQIPLIPVLRCQTRRSRSQKAYESRTPHRARVVRKHKHKYTITILEHNHKLPRPSGHPHTPVSQSVSQLFHGPAPRSTLRRLAVRLRRSRSNTSTECGPYSQSRHRIAREVILSQRAGWSLTLSLFAAVLLGRDCVTHATGHMRIARAP